MGGESGHVVVQDTEGAPCGCGGYGCLEQYASATAVVRMARELMESTSVDTARAVAVLARSGDAAAAQVFQRVGHALAIALTGLINTLNLPLYLLGGGVCEAWDLFASTMFRELQNRSYVYRLTQPDVHDPIRFEPQKTYILRAQLGTSAGLLGSCLLPLQKKADTRKDTWRARIRQSAPSLRPKRGQVRIELPQAPCSDSTEN
jgi:glucokinase